MQGANLLDVVIVSGMSGAGKTVAIQAFEDMGYFCIDNLPPALLNKFLHLALEAGNITKVAIVIDLRARVFYNQLLSSLAEVESLSQIQTRILFLDATDAQLVDRYKETRRSHPLAMDGRLVNGITKERRLLKPFHDRAATVIDTTNLTPRQLRTQIFEYFDQQKDIPFHIVVMSFGFKYGVPIDADDMMDVRFLPNPYYDPIMKRQTGLQKNVADYVFNQPATRKFYQQYLQLLTSILPQYQREGKTMLTIAIGCTGGQHRSVAIAQKLGEDLQKLNYSVDISHRDIYRYKESVKHS
ncbi:RNase adapter RapZ [Bombilactobacillus folatiphilus]|uniref:RNase adapter RapZ n=1 Tax=Bombilactobacillus folatiphilus TaxID=2923362 RepID=A0ABY4P7L0_9LACO|nr:RNase adapter RapZ [Bombilactobacillus folatiphilus]UQS81679.1 RNase adapter RapZ [Bombilactobacillus folatiphilus]